MTEQEKRAATGSPLSLPNEPARVAPAPDGPAYAGRFRAVYVLLAAAAATVIALAVHTGASVRPAPVHAVKHRWHPAGTTSFALARSIARHYTALDLKGFEAEGGPKVTAQRPTKIGPAGLGALQLPTGQVMAQIAILPTDVLYQLCGHGAECSLREAPSIRRELVLRRLTLQLAIDTFAVRHPPKHVLVSLPALPGHTWLVVFGRDELSDKQLAAAHALVRRLAKARHPSRRDVTLLAALTDNRIFAVSGQAVTEDQQVVLVLDARPCMDAACPGSG